VLDLRSVEPRKILPWSSALLQSAEASCPPGPALPRFPTAFAGRSRSTARGYLSWGSFPLRTPLRRVPLLATTAFATAEDEGRQTLAGAVLRVLAPLDGSGCARGALEPLRGPPLSVTPRRFAALFHAARVPGRRPTELSLPGEPCPLSRASCFLAGSWSTVAGATHSGDSPPLSPPRRALCLLVRPGVWQATAEP